MLPSWFAEYTLWLGVGSLAAFGLFTAFGVIVSTRDRNGAWLTDASRARPMTVVLAMTCGVGGTALLMFGLAFLHAHARLAVSGMASLLEIAAIASAATLVDRRLWTNEFWGLPPAAAMTSDQAQALARSLGRVYAICGLACIVAVTGALIGIIPKLVYVGSGLLIALCTLAGILLIAAGVGVGIWAWKVFDSVRQPARIYTA